MRVLVRASRGLAVEFEIAAESTAPVLPMVAVSGGTVDWTDLEPFLPNHLHLYAFFDSSCSAAASLAEAKVMLGCVSEGVRTPSEESVELALLSALRSEVDRQVMGVAGSAGVSRDGVEVLVLVLVLEETALGADECVTSGSGLPS